MYIIKDREHMKRVQGAIGESVLQKAVNNKGYQILAYWENGFRNITNNTRPINTPEDLKGVKLRTPKGAWRVKMFKLYGANPTPMAVPAINVRRLLRSTFRQANFPKILNITKTSMSPHCFSRHGSRRFDCRKQTYNQS